MAAHWQVTFIAVPIAGACIATVFYALRLYSRYLVSRKWDIGDLFLGLGLLFCYGISTCAILISFNGIGGDIWSLPRETRKRVTLTFWILQKFWVLAQLCVKVSIILLLRQLLGVFERVRLATAVLLVFTVAWGITAFVADILQCLPVQYFWIKSIEGHCMAGQAALFISVGALSLLEDIVLVLIPVIIVWRLKLARPQKIQLTLLFSAGVVTCVFSLLRLKEFPNYKTGNLTESGALETIWTILELYLAIMCASVVLMRPAVQRCLRRCGCISRHGAQEKASTPSSDFVQLFPEFVHGTTLNNYSQDPYSEVRAQAYRTPTLEMIQNHSDLAVHGIVVETSIDRDVRDREAILATIGDTGSIGRSTFGGSVRTGSVGSLHKS